MILIRLIFGLFLTAAVTPALADLSLVVRGVDDPLRSNILEHVDVVQTGRPGRLSERDYDRVISKTITRKDAGFIFGLSQALVRMR